MERLLFCIIFFLYAPVHSAYFYTSPDSLFPSGFLEQKKLEKKKISITDIHWIQIEVDNKKVWARKENLIFKKDLYSYLKINKKTKAHTTNNFEASSKTIYHDKYPICNVSGNWRYLCKIGWVYLQEDMSLSNLNTLGYGIFKERSHIFLKPSLTTPFQVIGAKSKILLLNDLGLFYSALFEGKTAYVYKNHITSFQDFDSKNSIYIRTKWLNAREEIDSKSLTKVPGFRLAKKLDEQTQTWHQSFVRGHGNVWWQHLDKKLSSLDLISNKTLFSKKIYDVAKSENIHLVSADGIYRSFDGSSWTKLSRFQNENHPLHITKDGIIFVGEYMSTDNTKNFKKYIKWSHIFRQFPELRNKQVILNDITSKQKKVFIQLKSENQIYVLAKAIHEGKWHKASFPKEMDLLTYGL